MASAGTIAIDGSKLAASTRRSKDSEGYEEWLQRIEAEIADILAEADRTDATEDEAYGDRRGDELPEGIVKREDLKRRIEEVMRDMKGGGKTNLTDPDARFIKERHGVVNPSHNCQLAVTEGQVIVGPDVTTHAVDRHELAGMIEQAERNLEQDLEQVIADSGYASYENCEYLAGRKTEAYTPDQFFVQMRKRSEGGKEPYHKDNATSKRERDCYICPEGKVLLQKKRRISHVGKVKRKQIIYRGMDCEDCPTKKLCTKQKARTVARELREDLLEEMRAKLLTEDGRRVYRKRMHTAEAPFGHLKHNLGYKTFLLGSTEKVRAEFKLMCIGYNLAKIWRLIRKRGEEELHI
ncbi:MAG: transposase [Actinomycetota bacterium]|nr:transposase [Actinomycetota bacterium]